MVDLTASRVPDFFIVGQPKCGTTALYNALRRHPQIFMPAMKEPRFFERAPDVPPARRPPGFAQTPQTLEQYLDLFAQAPAGNRVGEASPSYLLSHYAARGIAELQPNARIIAILREPASFLRSLHHQLLQIHAENEPDLLEAMALEPARREGRRLPPQEYWVDVLQYSEHVRYVEQLRRFDALFPPEQIKVLIYDDFRRDNAGTIRGLLRFLEVDDQYPIEVPDSNPTVRVRATGLYNLLHAISVADGPVARRVKAVASTLTPARLDRQSALAIRDRVLFAKPRPADEQLLRELRTRFKPEVVALGEYLNRDLLDLWGYDEVD